MSLSPSPFTRAFLSPSLDEYSVERGRVQYRGAQPPHAMPLRHGRLVEAW